MLRFVMDRNVLGCIELLEEIVMQGRELVQFVTDFTWYLRNLMLVQTADNLEDVIDMSTDNLANLKESLLVLYPFGESWNPFQLLHHFTTN